jgi:XRE family transcriptional regulator, aerobic/anaerobic benzoate catabolism transcriptional regulator
MGVQINPRVLGTPARPGELREQMLLASLGQRVRELRARLGMTRRTLSQEADVSERHLAQLEIGEGNISIVLLQRIAAALQVSLADLFTPQMPAFVDVPRFTRKNPAAEQRRRRIALIGMRGAGKSTLGALLAADLRVPFVELDREIEKDARMPLAEIFSLRGQSTYRKLEKRAVRRLLRERKRAVLCLGGGVVSEEATFDFLLKRCFTIWIKARPEEHMQRVLAQGDFRAVAGKSEAMKDLKRILEARESFYSKADLHIDTAGETPAQSFRKLHKALQAELA